MRSKTVTLLEIKRTIHRQLHDGQLSAATVAAQLHISESYLHRLFKSDNTTFGRYILASRLEQCRAEMADPRYSHRSISDIAFSWGFNSLNHFSHAFKKQFGVSPLDFRIGGG
ncbi:MAG: helix-turn-helix transcriptional regulator [Chloroflexales bacterium]|nr:helix-turn-helix transcriptional regulator [Chloroflexales bacterium]